MIDKWLGVNVGFPIVDIQLCFNKTVLISEGSNAAAAVVGVVGCLVAVVAALLGYYRWKTGETIISVFCYKRHFPTTSHRPCNVIPDLPVCTVVTRCSGAVHRLCRGVF